MSNITWKGLIKEVTKVKICGLSRECDIDYANMLMPDYIGFVFAKSRRQINEKQAEFLKKKLTSDIKTVGVFVNDNIERVANIANNSIIDVVQLHGNEDEEYICNLRKMTDIKIIKAFKVNSAADVENAQKSLADYIMLDNGNGGTGEKFNWNYIMNVNRKYFLAGGINENNLAAALKFDSYAIDISSGIETQGFKDYEKMKSVIEMIRNGESNGR